MKEKAKFVTKIELIKLKGSDASNAYNEKIDDDEKEFSDDDDKKVRKDNLKNVKINKTITI